jgi:hypothetical protein
VKSQFFLPKKEEEDPDSRARLDKWIMEHDAMTAVRADKLRAEGYTVLIEDQNSFKLEGKNAILSAKPDLVAINPSGTEALIVDEKSGKEKEQYIWQIILYMFGASLTTLKGMLIRGEIEYKNKIVHVRPEQLSSTNIERIKTVMQVMGSLQQPPTVPSASECMYCDVVSCADRFESKNAAMYF